MMKKLMASALVVSVVAGFAACALAAEGAVETDVLGATGRVVGSAILDADGSGQLRVAVHLHHGRPTTAFSTVVDMDLDRGGPHAPITRRIGVLTTNRKGKGSVHGSTGIPPVGLRVIGARVRLIARLPEHPLIYRSAWVAVPHK